MNERREPDDFAPHCPKCGREMTTSLMAAFCPLRKDCEFYSDGIEQFYPDDFLPIEGGGTTLYRPLMRDTAHMAGADGGSPSPSHVHREHTTASGEGSLRGIPHAWPEVDRRTHPANNVRPLVERRGPRASRFNDLETTR